MKLMHAVSSRNTPINASPHNVGFEIARGFHEHASDKKKALADLFELRDPDAILRASGYMP